MNTLKNCIFKLFLMETRKYGLFQITIIVTKIKIEYGKCSIRSTDIFRSIPHLSPRENVMPPETSLATELQVCI